MAKSGERRLRPRHGLADVEGNLLFSRTCRVLNLSGQGIAIETAGALAPGRSYSITISHDDRNIELAGTVAWCRLRGNRRGGSGELVPSFVAGIELEADLGPRSEDVLPLLLERGSLHLERRLAAHVTPKGTDATAPAVILVVSRNGLQMESPCFPLVGSLLDVRVELDDDVLPLTARVTKVRSLQERRGQAWGAISTEVAEIGSEAMDRLEQLLREEARILGSA